MRRRALFVLLAICPELAAYPVIVCAGTLFPGVIFTTFNFLDGDFKWLWSAVLVPIGLVTLSIPRVDDLLNPKGKRSALLEWPDYQLFKDLAVATLALYGVGLLIAMIGFYFTAVSRRPFGLILILAAVVQVFFTFGTLLLANWKSREILGE